MDDKNNGSIFIKQSEESVLWILVLHHNWDCKVKLTISINFLLSISKPVQTKPNDASIVPTEEMSWAGKSKEVQGKGISSKPQDPSQRLLLASLFFFFFFLLTWEKDRYCEQQVETRWPE